MPKLSFCFFNDQTLGKIEQNKSFYYIVDMQLYISISQINFLFRDLKIVMRHIQYYY